MKKFDSRIFMASVRAEAGENISGEVSYRALMELLERKDDDFIRQAYRQILGREVDRPGLLAYSPKAQTFSGKLKILAALLLSPERVILPHWLRSVLKIMR